MSKADIERLAEVADTAFCADPRVECVELSGHEPYDMKGVVRALLEALRTPVESQYDTLSATGMMWREMTSEFVWTTYIDALLDESQ